LKETAMSETPFIPTRRAFLKSTSAFGLFSILPSRIVLGNASASEVAPVEKVNLAVIGIGNRGNRVRKEMLASGHCNVVALCDVDMEGRHTHESRYVHRLTNTPPPVKKKETESQNNTSASTDGEPAPEPPPPEQVPLKARGFTDFRKMFDEMADEIDAVLIATPDHSHFAATMLAMSLGKHVYVEKPLAHTFGQCERLIAMAKRNPHVVTQMGNQGHSGANYFQFKAWTEAGLIKDITRITANMNNPRRWHGWGSSTTEYPSEPLPPGMDWDQWMDAVANPHPYSKKLHPQEWRSWYDYGSGCFGDWGPHILDTCHRFLDLGLPEKLTALYRGEINHSDLIYPGSSTIRFNFPARGSGMPACEVNWYDGVDNMPELEAEYSKAITDEITGEVMREATILKTPGKVLYGKDLVFKGGHHSEPLRIVPREKMMEMRESLPRFPQKNSNHYANFFLACKGEEIARSPFSVSGPLSQVFNLGVITQRLGGELMFDRQSKKFTNNDLANTLLDPAPRKGWEDFYTL
jgi:predicted dehydrogenase